MASITVDHVTKRDFILEDMTSQVFQRNGVENTDKLRFGFINAFANVFIIDTPDGLVIVDTGSFISRIPILDTIRGWAPKKRIHTVIFTHGHVDHVGGISAMEDEAEQKNLPKIRVVAHENVSPRFKRYDMTNGYNAAINQRQFQLPMKYFPSGFRHPDLTYRDRLCITVGGVELELVHYKGETDDSTIVWLPKYKVLAPGDLVIKSCPNCGNPQKVQRYLLEWRDALNWMNTLHSVALFPGHGDPVVGAAPITEMLTDTSNLLTSIFDQFIELFNDGKSLDEIIHSVKAPKELLDKPYLRPDYDEPEFLVRNLWRLYGGWYSGSPDELKPAPQSALAQEIVHLIPGGVTALTKRALHLVDNGTPSDENFRLACHLIETAWRAASESEQATIRPVRQEIYKRRAQHETSLMAKGVFVFTSKL